MKISTLHNDAPLESDGLRIAWIVTAPSTALIMIEAPPI